MSNYPKADYDIVVFPAPELIGPIEGGTIPRDYTFDWRAVPHAYYYKLQVGYDALFTNLIRQVVIYDPLHQDTSYLVRGLPSGLRYWRIAASVDGIDYGIWSATTSFTVIAITGREEAG